MTAEPKPTRDTRIDVLRALGEGLWFLNPLSGQFLFVIGIGLGAFIASRLSGTFKVEALPPMWVERFGGSVKKRVAYSLVGGVLAMVGARMAGGCPSGHGVSGMSQLGVSSLVALAMFFVGGIAVAGILYKKGGRA